MTERRRFEQTRKLELRLSEEVIRLRGEARLLRLGVGREKFLRQARRAETGAKISESALGFRAPDQTQRGACVHFVTQRWDCWLDQELRVTLSCTH
jgi:hypothetical protein